MFSVARWSDEWTVDCLTKSNGVQKQKFYKIT
jgi:hypothetical protein